MNIVNSIQEIRVTSPWTSGPEAKPSFLKPFHYVNVRILGLDPRNLGNISHMVFEWAEKNLLQVLSKKEWEGDKGLGLWPNILAQAPSEPNFPPFDSLYIQWFLSLSFLTNHVRLSVLNHRLCVCVLHVGWWSCLQFHRVSSILAISYLSHCQDTDRERKRYGLNTGKNRDHIHKYNPFTTIIDKVLSGSYQHSAQKHHTIIISSCLSYPRV